MKMFYILYTINSDDSGEYGDYIEADSQEAAIDFLRVIEKKLNTIVMCKEL